MARCTPAGLTGTSRHPWPIGAVPAEEREARVDLTADGCVIDDREFYAKGLLSLPVRDTGAALTWGVWVSLSEADFRAYADLFPDEARQPGAYFIGWIANVVPGFTGEAPLAAKLHVRECREDPCSLRAPP
ncbi:MAG: DUF2199 domain-containing protein [Myxococcota bacterium]